MTSQIRSKKSIGVIAGGLLFVSGQIALDPRTGDLVEGDIAVQTDRVLRNVLAILKEVAAWREREAQLRRANRLAEREQILRERD